jgi:putative SOS response-associated peptidase YedK
MCGRFTLRTPINVLAQQFLFDFQQEQPPRYNIAPTQDVATVRSARDDKQKRELALLRWGLVPSWADDLKIGSRMINARAETVAEKPAFRSAFKRRRCLVLADGFYEWKKLGRAKQPYLIGMEDGRPFAFAGLWETWSKADSPERSGQSPNLPVESCTIITTTANRLMSELHDRMPAILAPNDYERWLDPDNSDAGDLLALLESYPSEEMSAYPVGTVVNKATNDVPECVVEIEQEQG